MAALNRPTQANYEVHETMKIDTLDNEDHTFCGIMFPIKCREILPVEHIVIRSVAVRGQLGPMTVWVSNPNIDNDAGEYRFRLLKHSWTKVYQADHEPSHREYKALDLSSNPIVIKAGQVRAIYIHSTSQGDEAIVYDNSRNLGVGRGRELRAPRYQDPMMAILSGKAHLSNIPFGQTPIWGWGNAWRDHREFVGQIEYGAVYRLWNPDLHERFGDGFRAVTEALLACQRRPESPLSMLPDECIYYILNMCRWDSFQDDSAGMKARRRYCKQRRRLLEAERREQEEAAAEQRQRAAAAAAEAELARRVAEDGEEDGDDEDYQAGDEQDSDDEDVEMNGETLREALQDELVDLIASARDVDADAVGEAEDPPNEMDADEAEDGGNESDESEWERANGYRADNTVFTYRDLSSDDEDNPEQARTAVERQSWFRRSLARIHVLRALAGTERHDDVVDMDL